MLKLITCMPCSCSGQIASHAKLCTNCCSVLRMAHKQVMSSFKSVAKQSEKDMHSSKTAAVTLAPLLTIKLQCPDKIMQRAGRVVLVLKKLSSDGRYGHACNDNKAGCDMGVSAAAAAVLCLG